MEGKGKKRMNVAAALMGLDVPPADEGSEVEELLEEDRRKKELREKLRKMKPWQRKKYERDKQRVKISVRIPVPLSKLVDEISEAESVSPSSAALWLVSIGLHRWLAGVEQPELTKSRNLRTKVSLVLAEECDGERVKRTFDNMGRVKSLLDTMTKRYECGISDAFAWAMSLGAQAYRSGVYPEREPSQGIRYPFKLRIPVRLMNEIDATGEEKGTPETVLRRFFEGK